MVAAPVHLELWERVSIKPLQEDYFKGLEDPYEYVGKMPPADRSELGKKLLLIYGMWDDIVPASQGIGFSEKTKSKLIQVNGNHFLFYKQENYNTPQKLDRGIRCMLACHNREGGMARCVTCGEDMMLLLRPGSPWKL
jgi:fermentation-respiration switch protein FrsA (DUF1100 family)